MIIDISKSLPKGADAADFLESGITWDKFYVWAKQRVEVFSVVVNNINNSKNITNNNTQVNVSVVDPEAETKPPSESLYSLYERLGIAVMGNGHPIVDENNVKRILVGERHLGDNIWFDDFYNSVFIKHEGKEPKEIKDLDIYRLQIMLQGDYGFRKVSDATIRRAIIVLADGCHRNEPRDWMETLEWDGKPRIDQFCVSHLGAKDTPYARSASKNFWISLVARIYKPGCLMRTMLILKSKQWAGKSTAFSIIGGKWYSEALESIQSNNFLQSLHGKMIVEFADMSGMDRADVNRIKQVVSCRMDRFRAPYDRTPNDHLRQSVLVSTTNEGNFLKDDTGGSRFWPIETGVIRNDLIEADRSQLFAEAIVRYKNGEDWYKMPDEETAQVQESYRQADIWEDKIQEFLDAQPSLYHNETSIFKIATDCLRISIDKIDKSVQMRIARNLSTIGWIKGQRFENGKCIKFWRRNISTTDVDIS